MQTVVITYRTIEKGHPLGGEILVLEPWRRRTGSSAAGSSGLRVVWRHRNLNPWKLALADVDGNGRREIAVGVWKKSPKDPVMARRTFFYRWNGRRLLPKWLGSRLSRRFDDFALGDLNGDGWDELVALEIAPRGRRRISVYRWHSFGFSWLGGTDEFVGLNRLETVRGRVVASGRGIRKTVAVAHGRIILIK